MLKINNLEKHQEHAVVFPSFNLVVQPKEVVAIHSSTNVRSVLMELFMGRTPISNGEIWSGEHPVYPKNKPYFNHTSIFHLDDGVYERLKVKDHFTFYKNLNQSSHSVQEVLQLVHLENKKHVRVSSLTFSEQKRVRFAQILFQQARVVILEEPDQNVDLETKRVLLQILKHITDEGKCVLILTGNVESALVFTDVVYRLDETGLHALDVKEETEEKVEDNKEENESKEETVQIQPVRFEKIPTKVNDKIILFNPPEIDFIESHEGQSNLTVKGEVYPCMFTLQDLEERLLPYGFFRCHRSYIVNLQKVREVVTWTRNSYSLILDDANQTSIPLSKTKMVEMKDMLGLK